MEQSSLARTAVGSGLRRTDSAIDHETGHQERFRGYGHEHTEPDPSASARARVADMCGVALYVIAAVTRVELEDLTD